MDRVRLAIVSCGNISPLNAHGYADQLKPTGATLELVGHVFLVHEENPILIDRWGLPQQIASEYTGRATRGTNAHATAACIPTVPP